MVAGTARTGASSRLDATHHLLHTACAPPDHQYPPDQTNVRGICTIEDLRAENLHRRDLFLA